MFTKLTLTANRLASKKLRSLMEFVVIKNDKCIIILLEVKLSFSKVCEVLFYLLKLELVRK